MCVTDELPMWDQWVVKYQLDEWEAPLMQWIEAHSIFGFLYKCKKVTQAQCLKDRTEHLPIGWVWPPSESVTY